jgi:hypothetical protein
MFIGDRDIAATIQLRDLLDAHFENNENPHVTIARIWALVEGLDQPATTDLRLEGRRHPHKC